MQNLCEYIKITNQLNNKSYDNLPQMLLLHICNIFQKCTVGIITFPYMSWMVDQLVGNLENHSDYHLIRMVNPTTLCKDLVP